MSDVTEFLSSLQVSGPSKPDELLPLVYQELRRLASQRLSMENPGQTLQATALVHEAYIRLFESSPTQSWESRGHFFAAAAEAMRRILVERAREKRTLKRGGSRQRQDLDLNLVADEDDEQLLEIDEALDRLTLESPQAAEVVKLRYFAGLSMEEAASALGISRTKAYETWAFAKSWLWCALK